MGNYSKNLSHTLNIKLQNLLKDLPDFIKIFFTGIDASTAIKTRIAYAIDLKTFLTYLISDSLIAGKSSIKEITIDDISTLDSTCIEQYLSYLSYYEKDNISYTNSNSAKARKLSSIRSMYKYFYKKGLISADPSVLVGIEAEESSNLLDGIEYGEKLTKAQLRYHEKTNQRDLAVITLFLGTGIRISELVGIDIGDINFSNNSFKVTRKGGNEEILYFGDEVKDALTEYYNIRKKIIAVSGNENALFLSLQKKRMQVSSVQKMLKKYIKISVPLKNISPHKLRSTFGTNLYRQTGDIYLVAEVLGHKDVNTTKRYYAAANEEDRKYAAKQVKLR